MWEKVLPEILIAAIASIISCIANRASISGEVKKTKKDRINENRVPLYIELYKTLEKNRENENYVFNREYIEELNSYKSRMKVIASKNVLEVFKTYYNWVIEKFNAFDQFCKANDPDNNWYPEIDEDGWEIETPGSKEQAYEVFDKRVEQYIIDRRIDKKTVRSKIQSVLNAMRADIGNDLFIDE